jgi:hypothetical protein
VATPTVHLHCYFEKITETYTADDWFAYLRGADAKYPRWTGIDLDFQTNKTGGVLDFKNSLRDPGSVVIYLGHSALDSDNKYSLGLSPRGLWYAEMADMDRWDNWDSRRRNRETGEKPRKPEDLMSWLKTSPAKLVILASCSSATIPFGLSLTNFTAKGTATWKQKVAGGPALVVTDSPKLTTWSYDWAYALTAFLLDLIDYEGDASERPITQKPNHGGTIQSALDAANVTFTNHGAHDTFVLVNGTGSTVVFRGDRSAAGVWKALDIDWDDDPQP